MAEDEKLLMQIINDLRSTDPNRISLAAVQLRKRNWQYDGTLRGINLTGANLEEMDLWGWDLGMSDLTGANLARANLQEAILDNAVLLNTNLREANLFDCVLLSTRNITMEQLMTVSSLEGCTLPDGVRLPRRKEVFESESNWREIFEQWSNTVLVDSNGFIITNSNLTSASN